MHLHGSRLKRIFVSRLKTLHHRRAMSYTLLNGTPRQGTPSSPFPEPVFQHSEQPCEDQRPQQRGALTETPPCTGYEPNRTAEDCDRHFTGDGQFTEPEDLRVRPLSFHQSIVASTYDSAESIATHPNRTLTTNKFVLCKLHRRIYRSEEQVQNERKFISRSDKYRETCRSVFQDRIG